MRICLKMQGFVSGTRLIKLTFLAVSPRILSTIYRVSDKHLVSIIYYDEGKMLSYDLCGIAVQSIGHH